MEIDLSGECETEYNVQQESADKYIVLKQKDLYKCQNENEQLDTYSSWKNTLLKHSNRDASYSQCKQIVEGGQVKSVKCESRRSVNTVLPHFGVDLISSVELEREDIYEIEQQSAQVPERWIRHPHKLMMTMPKSTYGYQHQMGKRYEPKLVNGRQQLKMNLDQICNDIQMNGKRVTTKTPELVQQLAETMRWSNAEDVQFVWKNIVQNGNICEQQSKKMKDIFVNMAASVMDHNSAFIVRDELLRYVEEYKQTGDRLSLEHARRLALSVAYATEPTPKALEEIVPELIEKIDDSHIILSLSALVAAGHNQHHQYHHEMKHEFTRTIYETILAKVYAQLSQNPTESEASIVRILTALENVALHQTVKGQERLAKIITDKQLPISVRVAAVKATEQIEKEHVLRQALLNIFADRTEENELRLFAYRTLVYSKVTVEELKQILSIVESDLVNEDVRNYVCSHQKNLRTTDDMKKRTTLPLNAPIFPEPQSIANLLLSRSYEYSFVNPKTQIGAIVEAELIMERESRIPRSVTFNLTVPVAEQQIPIVEFTVRQRGMEQSLIERLQRIKSIRSPAMLLREVSSLVRAQQQKRQSELEPQGQMQIFVNVDGKNVYVYDSVECQKEHGFHQLQTLLTKLYKRLPIQFDETTVVMPLKHRVRLPTTTGLPINFELNSTLIFSVESQIIGHQGSQEMIEMHLKPTFVVEQGVGLSAEVSVSNDKTKRLQFVNRFISAPTLHMKIHAKPSTRQFKINLLMPEQEQVIARFETEFTNDESEKIVLHDSFNEHNIVREVRKALKKRSEQHQTSRQWYHSGPAEEEQCLTTLKNVLGFTYCVQRFSVDDLKNSLDKNTERKLIYLSQIKLVKTDKQMEGIELSWELPQLFAPESTTDELKFVFHFDTPRSTVSRRFDTELVIRIPQQQTDKYMAQLEIVTPMKKFSGHVSVLNQDVQKSIKVEFVTDGDRRQFLFDLNTLFAVQERNNQQVKMQLRFQPTEHSQQVALEGEFVIQMQSENKKKIQLRLAANEKQVVDFSVIKSGSLLKPENLKLSSNLKLDIVGVQFEWVALLHKNHQAGTIKSTSEIKYNRFLSYSNRMRRNVETISFDAQYTGFNQPWTTGEELKKYAHITVRSTQFPLLNKELAYNIKGVIPAEFSQEFTMKWLNDQTKRIHFVHESKQLSNTRTRNVKHQTRMELEITPLEYHQEWQLVLDVAQEQQPKTYGIEFKAFDRLNQKSIVESRFAYVLNSKSPLKMEANGEIKIDNGKHIFQYRDILNEVSQGVYTGKTTIELPESQTIRRSLPKMIEINYTYKQRDTPIRRIHMIEGRLIQNFIAKLINSLEQFEHEITFDRKVRHTFQLATTEQNELRFQCKLEREQRPLYKVETEIIPDERLLKVKFECEPLEQLSGSLDAQWTRELKRFELRVDNRQYRHHTRCVVERNGKYELDVQTKKNQKVVFELYGKKQDKSVGAKFVSKWIETEIELENVEPRIIRSMLKKRSLYVHNDDSQIKFLVKLPRKEWQHQTYIQVKPTQRQLVLNSQTRVQERNWFKCQIELQPEEKSIVAEYKNGYFANVKLVKSTDSTQYELVADYRIEPKQWSHKTNAKWTVKPSFRLVTLEMKNHLGPKNVFDLVYKCNENNPSAEYAHEYIVSTLDTHAELKLSRFGFDYNNKRYQPKALFTCKTKKFGGIEHKTELKQFDLTKKHLQLYSNTVRRGEEVANVELNLNWIIGQQSNAKIELLNRHKINVEFVPFERVVIEANYADKWEHQIRFEHDTQNHRLNGKIVSLNKENNEKWNLIVRHECFKYTTIEVECPVVRGNMEIRLDTNKFHVELKGDKRFRGLEHNTDAEWKWSHEKKLVIKSTTQKEGRQYAVIESELYWNMDRTSTIKMEYEPLKTKLSIQCEPKVGCEFEFSAGEWKHQMQIKKRSTNLLVQSETRKNGQIVALIDTDMSPRKVQFKVEFSMMKRFSPITANGKIDLNEKEVQFEMFHQHTNRLIKGEARMKDLKNVHFECQWDVKNDQTKQIVFQVRVEDNDSQRFIASIRGDIIDRPFEVKIDVPRTTEQWLHGYHKIEADMKNRKTNDQYVVKYVRKYEQNQYESSIVARKNEYTILKTDLVLNIEQESKKVLTIKVESDLKYDLLNWEINLNRECAYQQCDVKATAIYGLVEKKMFKFEGANVADALRGQFVAQMPNGAEQTIKFEFIKPESKLQINVYNQSGRQLDLNVDLARPLQKKFQIVSFLESIPTVDIESAHGENSRLVIEVSFQQEKKMELAINWFGQWRRDFKLEALFKCFSKPSIEMLITSRHPAGVDEIDAMLKFNNNEYVGKVSRKFDETRKNWNTKCFAQINNEKKFDLMIEAETKLEQQMEREVKQYKAQLGGLYRINGQLTVTLQKVKHDQYRLEKIECEMGNHETERYLTFDLYLQAKEQAQLEHSTRTGVKVTYHGKPVFGLVHHTNGKLNNEYKRTSIVQLELPDQIEYLLRNEIEYNSAEPKQLKSIRSELKRKHQSVEPIYQTRVNFYEDKSTDMKVIRAEIHSARFPSGVHTPKVIELRYNFEPKQCYQLDVTTEQQQQQHEQKQRQLYDSSAKCYRAELLIGEHKQKEQEYKSEKHFSFKIGAEYVKYPIDSRHYNRTVRFTIQSAPESQYHGIEQHQIESLEYQPINFTMIGHVSIRSIGMYWDNHNRHGQHKSGLFYLDSQPIESNRNMVNMYGQMMNKRQPSKDMSVEMHFSPQDIRKTMQIGAKWDQDRVRRMIVGELPELHELVRSGSAMKINEIKRRTMRNIKEEIAHKWDTIQNTYNDELIQPLVSEIENVENKMKTSEDEIAQQMTKHVKRAVKVVNDVYENINVQDVLVDLYETIVESCVEMRKEMVESLMEQCRQHETCSKLLTKYRDYEIKQFLTKRLEPKFEAIERSLKRAVPTQVLESIEQFARQFVAAHDDEYDAERWEREQQYHDEDRSKYIRHSVRLLKMVQPESSEIVLQHLNKINKRFDNDADDSFYYQHPKTQQQQLSWPEIRGAVHDMAVDVIDKLQYEQKQQQQQPFWSQFYGQQKKSQGMGYNSDYLQYANKWNNHSNKDETVDHQSKSNVIFSPKRGEFQLLNSYGEKPSYWTRA